MLMVRLFCIRRTNVVPADLLLNVEINLEALEAFGDDDEKQWSRLHIQIKQV